MTALRAIVAKMQSNPPESGRDALELLFVLDQDQLELRLAASPEPEWTPERGLAREMSWEEAEKLAREIGFPAHAIVVAEEEKRVARASATPHSAPRVSAQECFENYERQGLA